MPGRDRAGPQFGFDRRGLGADVGAPAERRAARASSTDDHIHDTCWSARRAANEPVDLHRRAVAA